MNSNEIKFDRTGLTRVSDAELEARNQNNFNGLPLDPGSVVVFPADEIEVYPIPIRKFPNAEDKALAEKNVAKIAELKAKDNLSKEETDWLEKNESKVTPEACIPNALYALGHDAASNDGILVYLSYLNRWGSKKPDEKNVAVDELTKYMTRSENDKVRVHKLKGKTITVSDVRTSWWMNKYNSRTEKEEREILEMSINE